MVTKSIQSTRIQVSRHGLAAIVAAGTSVAAKEHAGADMQRVNMVCSELANEREYC
jgi:hypothetical protein